MGKIGKFFGNPGSRPSVSQRAPMAGENHAAAPAPGKKTENDDVATLEWSSDESSVGEMGDVNITKKGQITTSHGFTGLEKDLSDRTLDKVVRYAGTQIVFFLMWVVLVIWIVIGIVYKAPENWQVVMQDGQSLQCYFWDTLLMRQQLNSAHEHINVCALLRSRIKTFKTLSLNRPSSLGSEKSQNGAAAASYEVDSSFHPGDGDLPIESWYDRLSTHAGKIIGSLPAIIIFWIGIFVWIGCGALPLSTGNTPPFTGKLEGSNPEYKKFSDLWQLCINTATAVTLLICTMFLQNIRARHDKYITKLLSAVFDVDIEIEEHLRSECGDFTTPNEIITIHKIERSAGEKMIDWYADVIGTGIGICIAIAAVGAWIGVGSTMHWNSNWWLIIGTYTGLIGFLDGFVLRQVYFRIVSHEQDNYSAVAQDDAELFEVLGIHCPDELFVDHESKAKKTVSFKISDFINRICSSQWSVLVSVIIILALIIIASVLHWSTTGQLIANTPTMIIEEFFLIVLIQAHNWADKRRRVDISTLYARRCLLRSHFKGKQIE
ncbi:LANO_0E16754g1_1 [Lachancea nothofagi CBS 11611]|uniref:LANO_0E16754g1_1 n=1 Tax=Lachancea nothofagi CBS 11611 TaxID=1266666 RepID=A0A1G4K295_9SACH|nr:LANO_0E16754g1_1 [Lachancea nothofagi CBS 11611]